ncbi:MAG: isoprenyl transferase [Bacteroidales bacterium]|nr:isoprenyl transferase [Bacteroidales bacterium]
MDLKEKILKSKIPEHVVIIMDGNGRWARKKGNQRIFGHKNAIQAVRDTVEGAAEVGVKFLTLYAFSTENWNRPRTEIDALMSLLILTLKTETKSLHENNIQLQVIGDMNSLPKDVKKKLDESIKITAQNTGMKLILALSYSGRWEIVNAVKQISSEIELKKIDSSVIDENTFKQYLQTSKYPDPELLIRTSGEFRISNFLLWQIAYSELYFTEILWPDFRKKDLFEAIDNFQKRERRFGKISEQLYNEK